MRSVPRIAGLCILLLLVHTRATSQTSITLTLPGGVPLEMMRVPEGNFQMGSDDPRWSNGSELPVHAVSIGYSFHIGRYEVTQAQWEAVMGSNPTPFHINDDFPIHTVSWVDCQFFLEALNQLGQGTFRLPSEAEWEYSCRAGSTTRYYFGDSNCDPIEDLPCDLDDYAWWGSPLSGPQVVGQKLPNAFGLYDMYGNTAEWCQDYWFSDYTDAPTDGSARISPSYIERVIRGGFWSGVSNWCRSSARFPSGLGAGLRLVRNVYEPNNNAISIDVTPDISHWTLTGPAGFGIVPGIGDLIGSSRIIGAPVGAYTLACRYTIPGHTPPQPLTLALTAGSSIAFSLAYHRNPDTITIDVTPNPASWTLTGPAGFTAITGAGDRLDWSIIANAPVGGYTLTCDDNLAGYITPAPQTLTLTNGGYLAFKANYILGRLVAKDWILYE